MNMFVKIEDCNGYALIINIDLISSIKPCYELSNDKDDIIVTFYLLEMNNKQVYKLDNQQYTELCKVLTQKV